MLSEEKRAAILKGAMEEFLAHTYAGATMDRVAQLSGVSKATIYSHFGDKEALFKAIIQQLADQKPKTILKTLNPELAQRDPAQVLRQLANTMLDASLYDPELQNFMRLMIAESGRFPELARAFVSSFHQPASDQITAIFSHPALKIADPETVAQIFMHALTQYVLTQEIMHGKDVVPLDRERFVNALIELVAPGKTESARY